MSDAECITKHILQSAKYRFVGVPTIERIVAESVRRYGPKRAEDEAKRLLHQIWGMYYSEPDQKLKHVDELSQLLRRHRSTAERLPFLRDFYTAIFAVTGEPELIVDYACGLNPLAVASLDLPFPARYKAFDIDSLTVDILSQWFARLGAAERFTAAQGDLLIEPPVPADVALLLKVLPPLELQQRDVSHRIIEQQPARFVVVSYPIQSVSGKEKGMANFYREQLYMHTAETSWRITEQSWPTELVFIIQK